MDDKIIAIPYGDPTYNCYTDIEQLPSHIFDEIRNFFNIYKSLEGKKTKVDEFGGPIDAARLFANVSTYITKNLKEKVMTINKRLSDLRSEMSRHDIDIYVVPTCDFHGSEYIGDYFKTREL